jgi:hypothetical protein
MQLAGFHLGISMPCHAMPYISKHFRTQNLSSQQAFVGTSDLYLDSNTNLFELCTCDIKYIDPYFNSSINIPKQTHASTQNTVLQLPVAL